MGKLLFSKSVITIDRLIFPELYILTNALVERLYSMHIIKCISEIKIHNMGGLQQYKPFILQCLPWCFSRTNKNFTVHNVSKKPIVFEIILIDKIWHNDIPRLHPPWLLLIISDELKFWLFDVFLTLFTYCKAYTNNSIFRISKILQSIHWVYV